MEPSTLEPKPAKPPWWWVLVTIAAGIGGSTAAVAAGGSGSYSVGPFVVEMRARPAALGETEMAVRPLGRPGLEAGYATAGTHKSPIEFRATITGVTAGFVPSDARFLESPHSMATFMGQEGKDAVRSFGIKLALLAAGGGGAAGLIVSMGRWRRVAGGVVAGVLALAIVGLLVQQTYDKDEFLKTRFVPTAPAPVPTESLLPT